MTRDVKSPLLERVFGSLLLFTLSIVGIVWFILSLSSSIFDVINTSPSIAFNKGAMYMFGASITGFLLFIGVAYHSIFLRRISDKAEKILIRGAVIGTVIMIIFPHIIHFSINKVVNNLQYIECHQAGHSWLLHKKYVYTESEVVCQKFVKEIIKSPSRH